MKILEKISSLFLRAEFKFFVFFVFILVFSWPYMSFLHNSSLSSPIVYFLISWAVLIFLMFVSSIANENGDD